jgi:ubiquinol-cytochrome c reductase cytochrome c1 subunit
MMRMSIAHKSNQRAFGGFIAAIGIVVTLLSGGQALAAGGGGKTPENPGFSFEGPFGVFDQAQLQRGFKVYKEVCSSCHGMKLMSYRNLGQKYGPFYDPKYPNPNDNPYVKVIAAEYEVPSIDPDTGDIISIKATPSDFFKSPFPNVEAAAASNGGAAPPDLSVITKARKGGARYLYSFLIGYNDPPKGLTVASGQYYNAYVNGDLSTQWEGDKHHVPKGGVVAMPSQLTPERVTYDDGTKATVKQQAEDVAAFLEWAADPHATERKSTGLAVLLYLFLFASICYLAYATMWKGKH